MAQTGEVSEPELFSQEKALCLPLLLFPADIEF